MSTIPNRYNYTSDALDDLAYAVEDREWGKVQEAHANIIRDLTPEAMGIPELDGDRYHNPDYSEQQESATPWRTCARASWMWPAITSWSGMQPLLLSRSKHPKAKGDSYGND